MKFDRRLRDTDFCRDLFVQVAGNNQGHYLAFTRCQRVEISAKAHTGFLSIATGLVSFNRPLNRIQQILVSNRLCQELNGASFHGSDRHGNVGMRDYEDNRQMKICLNEVVVKI
jgi:hypothetical protein